MKSKIYKIHCGCKIFEFDLYEIEPSMTMASTDFKPKSSTLSSAGGSRVTFRRLCSHEYCANKYNLLRIFALFITFLLVMASFLYCIGSIYELSLLNVWCNDDEQYTWDEIIEHSREENEEHGVGGCWQSKRQETNDRILFTTKNGGFDSVLSVNAWNIFKLILFGLVFISLLALFIGYTYSTILDCKKTVKDEWYVTYHDTYCVLCGLDRMPWHCVVTTVLYTHQNNHVAT